MQEVRNFMHMIRQKDAKINRVASATHVGGQIQIGQYKLDGALSQTTGNHTTLHCFQFNASYTHGHSSTCKAIPRERKERISVLRELENKKKTDIMTNMLLKMLEAIELSVNEYNTTQKSGKKFTSSLNQKSDCDRNHAPLNYQGADKMLEVEKNISYQVLLEQVYAGELEGFLGTDSFFFFSLFTSL